jgi:ketosteroid isomerase-like protein
MKSSLFKILITATVFVTVPFIAFQNGTNAGKISRAAAYAAESSDKRLEALESRVQAMEDLEAIKQLQYRYKNAFMQAKWDEVLDCFSQDATLDIKPDGTLIDRGMKEVKSRFDKMAKAHVGAETDFMYHPIITVSGNTAKGTWWVTDTMHIKGQGEQSIYGIYTVEYVKENGKWKISLLRHRHRTIVPAEGLGPPPD